MALLPRSRPPNLAAPLLICQIKLMRDCVCGGEGGEVFCVYVYNEGQLNLVEFHLNLILDTS